jgi:hypothetical protein
LILSSLFTLRTIVFKYFIQNIASEADLSLFERSATQDSSQTRARGLSAYTIWIHSRTVHKADREDPKLKYCIYCTTLIYRTSVTTNIRRYLLLKYQIDIEREPSLIQVTTV